MSHGALGLLEPIRALHELVRDEVVRACENAALADLARVEREDDEGDTTYAVDCVSEERVVAFLEREVAVREPLLLVAEGIAGGRLMLPRGAAEADARYRVIVDPIDGTRGLMYQKRSAWVLTGVAPNHGEATCLADVEVAVQTEIPLLKQHQCDVLWAVRGQGARAERHDRLSGARRPLELRPSRAAGIAHGFATIARFFPGAREVLAAIDEEVVRGALGPVRRGKAHCFEDQYISTAGQLYELAAGHDRFTADLRPLVEPLLAAQGLALGICCHPYDLSTELIARELGVVVTDERGGPLRALLSVEPDVTWVGYANPSVRAQIEPLLQAALSRRGLLPQAR